MIKAGTSKYNILALILIAGIAISMSLVSFQFSNHTENEIRKIAAENVRASTKIGVHDLENILSNKISSVSTILRVMAIAPSVQDANQERARILFNGAQESTSDLTDFYMWLDSEGKLLWLSNINQTAYETFKGTDLSERSYFIEAKNGLDIFYSSVIDSNDNIARLYVSYPIVNNMTGEFIGVTAAGIRLDEFGTFLRGELAPEMPSSVGMVDRDGIILYSQSDDMIGKNIFGPELQGALPAELKDSFNEFMRQSIQGNKGISDFSVGNATATIAYQPIILGNKQFGTLYLVTPHNFASNVGMLIDQQRNLTIIMNAAIGAAAVGVAILVVTWNTRLQKIVDSRTTELKRSRDFLAIANEQLQVHEKLQKEFINVAAHELRTPTQAILGYAELLQMGSADTDEMVKAIYRNSVRLQRLTSDILDVTRIESESFKVDKEKFNLSDVINSSIQDAKNQIVDGKVKMIANVQDIIVHADKSRIIQVVSNLLDNAIKFTKEGSVAVSTETKNGQVAITVKDTGNGIDPSIMPRLFGKFATKSDKGTGLGLFISKNIIEAHDGRIWCYNNVNEGGASFTFTLPISTAQDN